MILVGSVERTSPLAALSCTVPLVAIFTPSHPESVRYEGPCWQVPHVQYLHDTVPRQAQVTRASKVGFNSISAISSWSVINSSHATRTALLHGKSETRRACRFHLLTTTCGTAASHGISCSSDMLLNRRSSFDAVSVLSSLHLPPAARFYPLQICAASLSRYSFLWPLGSTAFD